ncbi:hypothetical protein KPL37_01015 [Clostridium frigoris]|uniref:Uncharacterized protein n=1 Tax=Clostridium frigoris TaxID=205327 RepID=A0ABS6BPL8_9CLOT|nr:hypothetical protein [Clostridium frigoris]MBU3158354.1 hypothetical protein [Clostridium frigoris]
MNFNEFIKFYSYKIKGLGSWQQYLEMRETIIKINVENSSIMSTDLGAISGLLFDIGICKISLDINCDTAIKLEKDKLEKALKKRHVEVHAKRLMDLSTSFHDTKCNLYLVAPDSREKEIIAQLRRLTFKNMNCRTLMLFL